MADASAPAYLTLKSAAYMLAYRRSDTLLALALFALVFWRLWGHFLRGGLGICLLQNNQKQNSENRRKCGAPAASYDTMKIATVDLAVTVGE